MSEEQEEVLLNEEQEVHEKDYSNLSLSELLAELKQLAQESIKDIAEPLRALKKTYDHKLFEVKEEALQKFIAEGGVKDDFEFRLSEVFRSFDELYTKVYKAYKEYKTELEETKKSNLKKKEALLEELRELVSKDETQTIHNRIKEIQEQWKELKQLPKDAAHDLWSNYKGLLDIYYNNRSIYFDLKNLDRKKNLDLKKALCDKVEALLGNENIKEASEELNQLHAEYKNIGPVPEEEKDAVWEKFKSLSDQFHEKRKEFFEDFKKQLEENAVVKKAVAEEMKRFEELVSDSIDEWKAWSTEVLALQDKWKAIGQVPNADVKELNKAFWDPAKKFFENKRSFFKKLDGVRKENLDRKRALCEEVEAVLEKEFEDTDVKTVLDLQKKWKKVGPVPKAHNEKVYARFKKACDEFFNRRREDRKAGEKEQEQNFEKKKKLAEEAVNISSIDGLKGFMEEWHNLGFVPKNVIKEAQELFKSTCDALMKNLNLSDSDKVKLQLEVELGAVKGTANAGKLIDSKRTKLMSKIKGIQAEKDTLNNNKEFFRNSKNAEEIMKDMDLKIENLEGEISELKQQVKILNSF